MSFLGNSPEEELLWVDALAAGERRAQAAAAAWDESTALNAARIARMAPWLEPGTLLAMAKGHVSPDTIETTARLQAQRMYQQPNVERGSLIRASELNPGDRRLLSETRRDFARSLQRRGGIRARLRTETRRDVARSIQHEGRPEGGARGLRERGIVDEEGRIQVPVNSPTSFLDPDTREIDETKLANSGLSPEDQDRFRQAIALVRSIASTTGEDVSFFSADGGRTTYSPSPMTGPRQITGGLGQYRENVLDEVEPINPFSPSGVIPESVGRYMETHRLPTLGDIPGLQDTQVGRAARQERAGLGAETLTETVQSAGMVLNAPVQEFQGQVRNVYGAATGRTVDWWEPQSDFLIAARTDMEPGDGLLVDPDSEVAQERMRREAERGMIYGQRVTLGRIAAGGAARIGVIEPGDTAYRVMSGLVDAGVQIFDPTVLFAGGVSKGLAARHVFTGAAEELATEKPQVATATLRSLAANIGVRGRGAMSRDDLITTLLGRNLDDLTTPQVRQVATSLNIAGRTRMNQQALLDAVKERWQGLGASVVTPGAGGPAIPPTGRLEAAVRGVADEIPGLNAIARRTGLTRGSFTNGVHGPTRDYFLQTPEGSRIVEAIAAEPSPFKLDELTGYKLTPEELTSLADAADPVAAREALRPLLATRMTDTKSVWRNHIEEMPIFRAPRNVRALQDVPGTVIDLDDPRSALNETKAWLVNAKVPTEVTEHFFNRMTRARTYDEAFAVVEDVMGHTEGVLAQAGVPTSARPAMVKAFRREVAEAQQWFLSEATQQQSLFDEIDIGGKSFPTGTPHDWTTAYNRFIYLPDYRAVRRAVSDVPNWAWDAKGQLRMPAAKLMALQEDIWKPLTLLRVAWPVRVIAEEQLRMGASGLSAMFSDPLSYIAWVIARPNDAVGEAFDMSRAFQASQTTRTNGWINERPGRVRTGKLVPFAHDDEGFADAWGNNLLELHQNPVARQIAMSGSIDEVEDWLRNGAGREVLDRMLREHPERFPSALPNPVRDYIEVAARWNDYMTGGHDELLDVIRTGRIGRRDAFTMDRLQTTPYLKRQLSGRFFDQAPERILGPEIPASSTRWPIVERAFSWLMGHPTNKLSRSPVFRQTYWERTRELISFATPEAKAEILANAEKATRAGWGPVGINIKNAPARTIRDIEATGAKGRLTAAQVDDYAKGHALDETKRLLYDLSRKSQIADSMRLVAPFGEAWREVMTRWADLANPTKLSGIKNIRRFQQTIQGARGTDLGELLGAPSEYQPDTGMWEQQGFFWKDEFGEEVFMYPGSQWLTGLSSELTGEKVPAPLVGRVSGLNMMANIMPGIGPVAALPVAWLLPDKPGLTREIREALLPFGHPTESQGGSAISQVLNYAPPWMRTAAQALLGGGYEQDTNRLYANSVMYAANYLYSTGRYDISTESGKSRLLEDARNSARGLYAMRAFAAFGAPSAPKLEFLTRTNEGLVRTAILRDEYYRLIEDEGYENADEIFLDRFGPAVGLVMQGHTRQVTGGVEPTQQFDDWANGAGSTIRRDFPAVWGFFGPDGGKFDYQTYVNQIHQGDRQALTPRQWLNLGQNHLGQMLRDLLLDSLGPEENWTDDDRAFKRDIEQQIAEEYPGFEDFTGLEQRASTEQIMRELATAVTDDRIKSTETGQAVALYLEARDKVVGFAYDMGLNVDLERPWTYDLSRARSLAEDRAWLFEIGEQLVDRYPDFARLWEHRLMHEVRPEVED